MIIKETLDQSKYTFSLQLISTDEQVQELINEFEIDDHFREKNQLSLNGRYNF